MGERVQPEQRSLDSPLETLTSGPGVLGAMACTDDGLPLLVRLQSHHDRDALAAAGAELGEMTCEVLDRLKQGELEMAVLETEELRFLVRPLSMGFLLVMAESEANVGLLSVEMSKAAAAIEKAVSAVVEPDLE
ncbi:MAG: roadblock/LC7 domain-containing protein [Proteobacteria bacterium]|nr:roadblock/LC7 domain-containing protein [Pseudomonadota bacterium]